MGAAQLLSQLLSPITVVGDVSVGSTASFRRPAPNWRCLVEPGQPRWLPLEQRSGRVNQVAIPATKSCATLWEAETNAIFSTTALVPLDTDHEVAARQASRCIASGLNSTSSTRSLLRRSRTMSSALRTFEERTRRCPRQHGSQLLIRADRQQAKQLGIVSIVRLDRATKVKPTPSSRRNDSISRMIAASRSLSCQVSRSPRKSRM
jgi:hypothetical protein